MISEEKDNLLKLVSENDLDKLENRLNKFNIFNILKLNNHEIRHSNFLGWLLNSKENHNLGTLFLEKFLIKAIFNANEQDIITLGDLYSLDLSDFKIYREKWNIDLLLISKKEDQIAIIIENKIGSKEHSNQLSRYNEIIELNYPGYKLIRIFLTKLRDEPENNAEYISVGYEDIFEILKFIKTLENIDPKVMDLINQYYDILEVMLMDKEIEKLCKDIYAKHKDAINLIQEYAITSNFYEVCEKFKDQNKDIKGLLPNLKSSRYWFLREDYDKVLPNKYVGENWGTDRPIAFWFLKRPDKDKLYFSIEVGPFLNKSKRVELLNLLKPVLDRKISDKAISENAKYTRIYTKNIDIEDWENEDELLKELNKVFLESKPHIDKIYNQIKEFKW